MPHSLNKHMFLKPCYPLYECTTQKRWMALLFFLIPFLVKEVTVSCVGWFCYWGAIFGLSMTRRLRSPLLQQSGLTLHWVTSAHSQAPSLKKTKKCNSPKIICAIAQPSILKYVSFCAFCRIPGYPNNEKKKLVYLGGTIPVVYEGTVMLKVSWLPFWVIQY